MDVSDFPLGSRAVHFNNVGTGLLQRAAVSLIGSPGLTRPCFDVSSPHVTYSPSSAKYDLAHMPISRAGVTPTFDIITWNLSSCTEYFREAAGVGVRGSWPQLRRRSPFSLTPCPNSQSFLNLSKSGRVPMYRLCSC